MTLRRGYSQLDTITKAKATNTHVSSTVVYKDLVKCMPQAELKTMDKAIGRVFVGVGAAKMYARPQHGGYGVIELSTQMQGHRAAVLSSTLLETDKKKITPAHRIANLGWVDFLLEESQRFLKNLNWTCTCNEQLYLKAWYKVVNRTRVFRDPSEIQVLSDTEVKAYLDHPVSVRAVPTSVTITESEAKELGIDTFRSLSKKKQEKEPAICPKRFSEICPEIRHNKRWKKFWKALFKEEWLL
ncbi:hypothetical protein JCM33374_g5115 [Metschnikowia sp. JCM 33374]|nr:hypothetical protein JCM33374_g5115 [Metschnikowia sp. JCM 33374]